MLFGFFVYFPIYSNICYQHAYSLIFYHSLTKNCISLTEKNDNWFLKEIWMIPSPKGRSLPRLVEIGTLDLEKKIFKCRQSVFTLLLCTFPKKWAWPYIWTNLDSLHPKDELCQVSLKNWQLYPIQSTAGHKINYLLLGVIYRTSSQWKKALHVHIII